MKKLLFLLIAIAALVMVAGCSEKDKNPTDVNVYGYSLDQFISNSAIQDSMGINPHDTNEYRSLYAYEIVSGADGFSPRQSSNAGYDLNWNTFKTGFYVPSDNHKTWFDDDSMPHAFQVHEAKYLRMYRKVDVTAADGSTKLVELKGLPLHDTTNWNSTTEQAIKLTDLLQGIASYDSVKFTAVDGFVRYYHANLINDGFYLLNSEITMFPSFINDTSVPNSVKKFKKLQSIEVIGASAQEYNFQVAPIDTANLIFTIPADLSGLERTALTDYNTK